MPNLNIRSVDESLMRAVNVEAAKAGKTLRDWVIGELARAVGWEQGGSMPGGLEGWEGLTRGGHDRKTCRVYGCLICAVVEGKNG
jgi:hypothetical protein